MKKFQYKILYVGICERGVFWPGSEAMEAVLR